MASKRTQRASTSPSLHFPSVHRWWPQSIRQHQEASLGTRLGINSRRCQILPAFHFHPVHSQDPGKHHLSNGIWGHFCHCQSSGQTQAKLPTAHAFLTSPQTKGQFVSQPDESHKQSQTFTLTNCVYASFSSIATCLFKWYSLLQSCKCSTNIYQLICSGYMRGTEGVGSSDQGQQDTGTAYGSGIKQPCYQPLGEALSKFFNLFVHQSPHLQKDDYTNSILI